MYTPNPSLKVAEHIYATKLEGLYFLESKKFDDSRGYYAELARLPEIDLLRGTEFCTKQVNIARSEKNVIRGIHSESWNKLVTVTNGVAFCALVDLRPDSQTFGEVETFLLGIGTDALHGSIFIPNGIGNSLCVVSGPVDYLYYVDELYKDRDPSGDKALSLFDPDLAIEWPIKKDEMVISERDLNSVTLKELFPEKYA